jgi:hypothetical protein
VARRELRCPAVVLDLTLAEKREKKPETTLWKKKEEKKNLSPSPRTSLPCVWKTDIDSIPFQR